jgi:hypothetical protein
MVAATVSVQAKSEIAQTTDPQPDEGGAHRCCTAAS